MPPRINIPRELLEDLYVKQRKTIKEVSQALGINPITIAKNMKEYGIYARDVNSENSLLTKLKVTDEQFKNMLLFKYEFQKKSINKIAREFDIGQAVIRKYLKRYGITLRNHKESNKVSNSGSNNHKWNGGKRNKDGYIQVLVPDHPCAVGCGYVYEHRYVMEQHIGRFLDANEHAHHINGDRTDNRIENLQLLTASEHAKLHNHLEKYRAEKNG